VSAWVHESLHGQPYLCLVSRFKVCPDEVQILLIQGLFDLAVFALLPSPAGGAVLDFVFIFILVGDEATALLHRY
jgi:hypothetical protein